MLLLDKILNVMRAGLNEFSECSHWPPDEDTYECRSECHHRETCEALHRFLCGRMRDDAHTDKTHKREDCQWFGPCQGELGCIEDCRKRSAS